MSYNILYYDITCTVLLGDLRLLLDRLGVVEGLRHDMLYHHYHYYHYCHMCINIYIYIYIYIYTICMYIGILI